MSRGLFEQAEERSLSNHNSATASTWEAHAADLDRHESELRDIERSLRVQALRLEEHEDPKPPVVLLATERIATVTPELLPENTCDRSRERSQILDIAGERLVLIGDLSVPIERIVPSPQS